jgi:hypothetical protein
VDGLREDFLSGPALAGDQDVIAAADEALRQIDDLADIVACADDVVKGVPGLVSMMDDLLQAVGLPDDPLQLLREALDLGDVLEDADTALDLAVEHDGRQVHDIFDIPLAAEYARQGLSRAHDIGEPGPGAYFAQPGR